MKTALLITVPDADSRWLGDKLHQELHLVRAEPAAPFDRAEFDKIFETWAGLAEVMIVDAVSLDHAARWAIESLAAQRGARHAPASVIRLSSTQRGLFEVRDEWLTIDETAAAESVETELRRFLALHDARTELAARTSVGNDPSPAPAAPDPAGGPDSGSDAARYRKALRKLLGSLAQQHGPRGLVTEFVGLLVELLGVGRLALLTRVTDHEMSGQSDADRFAITDAVGIRREIVDHLRLAPAKGLGSYLARARKVLRRSDPAAAEGQIQREFELLGAEVAVPMFEDDRLGGVLTFSGRVVGEDFSHEELEMVYHLLTQLAVALRNLKLRQQVTRQQQFTSEVLANVQTGVVIVDNTESVVTLNRRAADLLGVDQAALLGRPLRELPGRIADLLYEVGQSGEPVWQHEVTLPDQQRPLGLSVSRIEAGHGAVTVALIDDFTQFKAEETQRREAEEREFFTRVAYRLSHELKNSLVSIKIFGQLLPERYSEKDFREEFSNVVVNEVNRVDVLVNNLTFFAQPLGLVYEEIPVTDLVDTCIDNVSRELARKKTAHLVAVGEKKPAGDDDTPVIVLKRNFSHNLPVLEGDRIRLMQAIEHLIRNAVQAMPEGGRLLISTADTEAAAYPGGVLPAGGAVRLEVKDTGEGIGLDLLPRVTEPFVTTRNVGVGLGLTIVKKILDRHSGRFTIDSMLGKGTTVTLHVPVAMQPHPEDKLLAAMAKHRGDELVDGETTDEEQNRLAEVVEQQRRRRPGRSKNP